MTGPKDDADKMAGRTLKENLQLSVALETLQMVEAYFDNRADIDDGIPNEAMRMLMLVRGAIRSLEGKIE